MLRPPGCGCSKGLSRAAAVSVRFDVWVSFLITQVISMQVAAFQVAGVQSRQAAEVARGEQRMAREQLAAPSGASSSLTLMERYTQAQAEEEEARRRYESATKWQRGVIAEAERLEADAQAASVLADQATRQRTVIARGRAEYVAAAAASREEALAGLLQARRRVARARKASAGRAA